MELARVRSPLRLWPDLDGLFGARFVVGGRARFEPWRDAMTADGLLFKCPCCPSRHGVILYSWRVPEDVSGRTHGFHFLGRDISDVTVFCGDDRVSLVSLKCGTEFSIRLGLLTVIG